MLYVPPYTYKEIIHILTKDGASENGLYLAAKLVGSVKRLNGLIKEGLEFTNDIKELLEYYEKKTSIEQIELLQY